MFRQGLMRLSFVWCDYDIVAHWIADLVQRRLPLSERSNIELAHHYPYHQRPDWRSVRLPCTQLPHVTRAELLRHSVSQSCSLHALSLTFVTPRYLMQVHVCMKTVVRGREGQVSRAH